jgi:hypothetical protein
VSDGSWFLLGYRELLEPRLNAEDIVIHCHRLQQASFGAPSIPTHTLTTIII